MFKTSEKQIIVNRAEDLLLLENNPVSAVPVTTLGEGTSRDDFDGWTATNSLHILPIAASFRRDDLVKIQKTSVKANSIPYGATNPNFSTPVNGSLHGNVLTWGGTTFAQAVEARRPSVRQATYTVNAVPTVGSNIVIRISGRSVDRNATIYQLGSTNNLISFRITPSLNTTALIAQRIANEINDRAVNSLFPIASATVAGSVITLVGKDTGVTFSLEQDETDVVNTVLDATFVITVPEWSGVNDFYNMDAYAQTVKGYWNKRLDLDVYLPVKGVFYTSYFITYRYYSGVNEGQADTINAEQTHLVDLKIFVNPALTGLVTKLDLVGGF